MDHITEMLVIWTISQKCLENGKYHRNACNMDNITEMLGKWTISQKCL